MRRFKVSAYLIGLGLVDLSTVWIESIRYLYYTYVFQNITSLRLLFGYPAIEGISIILKIYSSWLVVVISVERVLAVYTPFPQIRFSNNYKPYIVMVLLLICVSIQYAVDKIMARGRRFNLSSLFAFYSFIPSAIIVGSSIALIIKLLQRPNLKEHIERNVPTRRRTTIHVVIAMNILFLITTLPTSIYFFLISINDSLFYINYHVFILLSTLSLINNSFNFICYITTSRAFREHFKKLFFRRTSVARQTVYTLNQRNN